MTRHPIVALYQHELVTITYTNHTMVCYHHLGSKLCKHGSSTVGLLLQLNIFNAYYIMLLPR